ncbi:SPOR domain-containing protein [Thalassotalea sp. PS06]|uniref:SPOR domain-containing protein n=1 Tax=Thalassotalea sp. PS06 TaxID=2594005 RepID=UPI0011641248|nr:SPOR domain-containing protein [Thalassotalea sp. PS06]QDP01842.1 dedD protein [Thalassotalea sp. PS06]
MSTPFQNRLVGTIIVAAAAVIFLPEFLDGEKKAYQSQFEEIPQSPDALNVVAIPAMNEQALIAKAKPEPLANEVALDDEPVFESGNPAKTPTAIIEEPDEAEPVTQAQAAKPENGASKVAKIEAKPKSSAKASGWVIQLGSFRHKNNVQQLQDKLKDAGYTVFTRPVKTQGGTLTKVFIGPAVNRSMLEAELSKLHKLTGVQGRIAKFEPLG